MKDIRDKWLRLCMIVIFLFTLSSCGTAVDPDQPTPPTPSPSPDEPVEVANEIVIVTNGDANNINPILVMDLDGYWRTDLLFDALIKLDGATLEPVPHLAKDWDICEDQVTYTFYLNEQSRWHDGEPVTAHDLEFTVLSILSPDYTGIFQRRFTVLVGADAVIAGEADELEGLRVIDDYTLEMTLDQPYAPFLPVTLRDLKPVPKHLLYGEQITLDHDYSSAPVGNGPYKFQEWTRGQQFVIVANEDYWAGPPKMKKITQRAIPDMAAIAMALETGDADASIMPPPSEVPRLGELDHLVAHRLPELSIEGFEFNLTHPILSNPLVRQAIAHAVNVKPFTEQFLLDLTVPAQAHIVPSIWAHNPNISRPEYDPEKAKELLAQAGYPDGFEITVRTNAGNVFREQFTTYAQAELDKVGITMNIQLSEWGIFADEVFAGKYEMAFVAKSGQYGIPDPDQLYQFLHSNGAVNATYYSNSEVDALLDAARLTSDIEERQEKYWRIQEILMEELPILPCFYRPNPLVIHRKFIGFEPSGLGAYWNIYDWEIDPDWQ